MKEPFTSLDNVFNMHRMSRSWTVDGDRYTSSHVFLFSSKLFHRAFTDINQRLKLMESQKPWTGSTHNVLKCPWEQFVGLFASTSVWSWYIHMCGAACSSSNDSMRRPIQNNRFSSRLESSINYCSKWPSTTRGRALLSLMLPLLLDRVEDIKVW